MLLINLWHIPIHFGESLSAGSSATNTLMTYITYFIPFHVNLFILITGYFGGGKNCMRSLLKNLLLIYFYSIGLGMFSLIVLGKFSYQDTFLPISSLTWWFMTMYTVMLLISPIIEKYMQDCSRKTIYSILIGALFVDLYLGHFRHAEGIYYGSMGIPHFVCMYLLGVWIRKEGLSLVRRLPWKRTCLLIFILCAIAIQYKAIAWLSWVELAEYCSPYSMVMSVLIFLLFANVNISEYLRKPILFFSSSAISVYMITEYPTIREMLKNMFASRYLSCNSGLTEITIILYSTVIAFVIPCLIDKVRIPITNYIKDRIITYLDSKS